MYIPKSIDLVFPRQDNPPNPDNPQKQPDDKKGDGGGGGMSPVGIFFLVLFILLIVGFIAYVVYTHLRARRLGLPSPGWRNYIPFMNKSNSRGRPSTGPLGWIKSKMPGSGPGGGALGGSTGYTGASERSRRTQAQFGQLRQDDEEAWDARGYHGIDDDTELHHQPSAKSNRGREIYNPAPGPYYSENQYSTGGLGAPREDLDEDGEPRRGRSRSRDPPYPSQPPPKSNATRPMSGESFATVDGERRSVFREAM